MKQFLFLLVVMLGFSSQAQEIKFKIEGQQDSTVHLVRYVGKNTFYADTAQMINGTVTFDGSKQKAGLLSLYIPGQNLLDFVFSGEEDIYITSKGNNFMQFAEAKKSKENKLFYEYVQMIGKKRPTVDRIREAQKQQKEGSPEYEKSQEQIDKLNKEVADYRQMLIDEHGDMLAVKVLKMSFEIDIPDAPVDAEGKPTIENFQYKYFRNHFWDNIDLNDDRLARTKIFGEKMDYYFSKRMLPRHWDTILVEAFDFIDTFDVASDAFQCAVTSLFEKYRKSTVMGMNKVYIYLGKRYFCGNLAPNGKEIPLTIGDRSFDIVKGKDGGSAAHWLKTDQLNKLCEHVDTYYRLVIGSVPPHIKLRDTTDVTYHDFYTLDNEYTLLYFWDPECGHCKKITPKLQTLYEKKWRDRDIEIFAVGKSDSKELFDKWKKFIVDNNLEFINVGLTHTMKAKAMDDSPGQPMLRELLGETSLESINYQTNYDIFATPKVWVLDKDKKIVAYSLTVSQLEEMLDVLQGKQDLEKIFKPEKNEEDEKMH